MLKRPLYMNQIKPYIDSELIKIIIGIRRSGKSTLLRLIMDELINRGINADQLVYLNFEDYKIKHLKDLDKLNDYLLRHLSSKKTYIFIDEVQEVEGFEKVINSLNVTENVDIYLTGSNSKVLSSEYATLLSGRYIQFVVYPFSFKEMTEFHPKMNVKSLFYQYVEYGGFPIIQNFENDYEKKAILEDLYQSIVIKDIVLRHQIKALDTFDKYMTYLMNTIASQFSAQNIIKYYKNEGKTISKESLYNYIKYAKEVLLIDSAPRYDVKGKKLLTTNEKYFINDQGLRSTRFKNIDDIEKILENIVFYELLRRGFKVYVGAYEDKEVDFIAIKDNEIHYLQVTYIMGSKETRDREFNPLLNLKDGTSRTILSLDEFNFSKEGIIHKNIMDFLLEDFQSIN